MKTNAKKAIDDLNLSTEELEKAMNTEDPEVEPDEAELLEKAANDLDNPQKAKPDDTDDDTNFTDESTDDSDESTDDSDHSTDDSDDFQGEDKDQIIKSLNEDLEALSIEATESEMENAEYLDKTHGLITKSFGNLEKKFDRKIKALTTQNAALMKGLSLLVKGRLNDIKAATTETPDSASASPEGSPMGRVVDSRSVFIQKARTVPAGGNPKFSYSKVQLAKALSEGKIDSLELKYYKVHGEFEDGKTL